MAPESPVQNTPVEPVSSAVFDLETISGLSNEEIRRLMTADELIAVIRSVDYPFAGKERLEYFDRDTLERVVCLVRRWSCHRLGKPSL
jgi:hypothetical protein